MILPILLVFYWFYSIEFSPYLLNDYAIPETAFIYEIMTPGSKQDSYSFGG